MKYRARIRSNITNNEVYSELFDYKEGSSEYWWEDGNMGCDCNLEAYFDDEPQTGYCGETRYVPLFLELESSKTILITRG